MANTSVSLDKWRDYFRGANSDIFNIIEYAIMVAASDCPYDFKLKRDRIAEMLFTCKITKCFGCDRVELAVPNGDGVEKNNNDDDDKYKSGGGSKDTKESKVDNNDDDDDDDDHREVMEMNMNHVSVHSYGDAEALTDEIEEESQFYEEVLRIKDIFDNSEEESDEELFHSLRRLQLMPLSVETLKATEIGKSVNSLRKHGSKEIRNLSKTLIDDWKIMVDAWVSATTAIAGAEVRTESVKTSVVEEEEEGLPSPPLDEGAFFATPTSMELSQFFDGMDDDGNPRHGGEFNKNRENGRRPRPQETNIHKRKVEFPNDLKTPPIVENKRNQESWLKKHEPAHKPNRPSETGVRRPKPCPQPKVNNGSKIPQKNDKGTIQKKPVSHQQEKLNCNNEAAVRMKLEAAKRKLQERYQEAENAKKQRTIQVVEFQDLPKHSVMQGNHQSRQGNHHRQWAHGRH